MTGPARAAQSQQAQAALAQLSEEFFEVVQTADPLGATQVGAPGFDALVPEHGLWEANALAGGYVSPQAIVFMSVPAALLDNAAAADGYLQRRP